MRRVEVLQPAQEKKEVKLNPPELTEEDRRDIERAEGEGMPCWNTAEKKKIANEKNKNNEKPQTVVKR
ncbi:MAG: hypothetical protein HYT11_00085 [Candidatus Levybacteria bacterium]|nr:hypothetical protein [Candidatus Levybacteria bacterium]